MFNKLIPLLLFFALCKVTAQTNPYFGHLGREQGLAQMTIFSITQDPLGRMWFGTEEGVSRYDGSQVFSIKPSVNRMVDSSYYFRGCEIYNLFSTQKGDLYFTADSYLVHYDVRKDRYKQYNDWSAAAVTMLRDTLYFHKGRSNTYYRWDPELETGIPLYYLPVPKILETHFDSDGSLWIGTVKGLYYLYKGSQKLKLIIPDIAVSCYLRSSSGDLWAGTLTDGVFRIRKDLSYTQISKKERSNNGLNSNRIRALAQDMNGMIWIGSSEGLCRFDPRTDRYQSYYSDYKEGALLSSVIQTLFCDRQGRLWIGTASGGVSYLNPPKTALNYYPFNPDREDSLSGAIVVNVAEDQNGRLWLATDGGGLNCLDTQTGKVRHFYDPNTRRPLPSPTLRGITYDERQNGLYIASRHDGIFFYDIVKNRFESVKLNCPDRPSIHKEDISPLVLHDSYLYFATQHGLYRHSLQTGKTEIIDMINSVEFITFDSDGHLCYLLSNRIYRIAPNEIGKQATYHEYPLSIYVSFTTFIAEDDDKTFIVGTYSDGLMRFDPRTKLFSPFLKQPNDRISDYCYKIARLKDGNWIITGDRGVAIVNSEGEVLRTYLPDSGIPVSSLTRQCALHVSKTGVTYLAGVKGVTSLRLGTNLDTPTRLYLSNLYVNDVLIHPNDDSDILEQSLPFTSSLQLSNHQNNIRLAVASTTLSEYTSSFSYEYQLVGFDNSWITPSGKEIVYTSIPAGSYTLKVRLKEDIAASSFDDVIISLPIVVRPVWYRSWWAWMIWVALIALFVTLVVRIVTMRREGRRRLRQEHEKQEQMKVMNEEKLKFFTNISHEFRTPLTLISGQIDLFLTHPNVPSTLIRRLTKTQEQVVYMNRLITELLDFRKFDLKTASLKVSRYDLCELICSLCEPFEEMALKHDLYFTVNIPDTPCFVWIDPVQIRKVIVNLLSNAFKFTPEQGSISVLLKIDSQKMVNLIIANTGAGIPIEEQERLFEQFYQARSSRPIRGNQEGTGVGLALTRKIVELHGGSIRVTSKLNSNTSFTVSLCSNQESLQANEHIEFVESEYHLPENPTIILDSEIKTEEIPSVSEENYQRFSILLVEDNRAILDTLTELFTPFYEVITAEDGENGYKKCIETSPHLVVSDVLMPHKNGYELCREIKENIETSHIPVILLTALGLVEHNLKGLHSGADDYISKPFHSKLLLARVGNLIRNRELLKSRYHHRPKESIALLATTPLDKQFLQKAETIVSTHASEETFDVIQLAQQLALSRSTLFAKFKALTGMTPNDFIRSQRLRLAAEHMERHPEEPLKALAEQFAFCSPNYFSRCFRQQFGMSPKEYINRQTQQYSEDESIET